MNEVKATMDSLPAEIIENVCQFLSASDLASCCAVNKKWRDVCGSNRLWRVHCDKALAEIPDENNCAVKPLFKSPQPGDSTLTSISEWRLNFMKQIRLRNNWSSGKFKMEQLRCQMGEEKLLKCIFFKDCYLLMFKRNELEVWDVNKKPTLQSSFPFHTKPGPGYDYLDVFDALEVKGSDKFVTVDGLVVRVYRLCCVANKLELLHVFSFELTERYSENTEERARELFLSQGEEPKICTVVGNVFVAIVTNLSPPKMHIWNVETGQKLKEEDCPFSTIHHRWYTRIEGCDKTMNIILEGEELVNMKIVVQWYVYSLLNLIVLPFHKEHTLLHGCAGYNSIIFDKYIALSAENRSQVYNYLTSEIMFTAPRHMGEMLSFRHYVFIKNNDIFQVFNPRNPQDRIRPIECGRRPRADRQVFEAVGSMAIVSLVSTFKGERVSVVFNAIKKIEDRSKSMSVPFYHLTNCDRHLINHCGTKLVVIKLGSITKIQVLNFW